MRNNIFLSFAGILLVSWLSLYSIFKDHFRKNENEKAHIAILEERVEREKLKQDLIYQQFKEFQIEVALALPEALSPLQKKEEGYQLRQLASVVQKPTGDELRERLALIPLERARHEFIAKNFEVSAQLLQQFIREYPYSSKLPEAHLMLMESFFQQDSFDECLKVTQTMLKHYPENEVTGFAMIRLGKMLEIKGRNREAIEAYQTTIKSFPYRDVASEAAAALRKVEP